MDDSSEAQSRDGRGGIPIKAGRTSSFFIENLGNFCTFLLRANLLFSIAVSVSCDRNARLCARLATAYSDPKSADAQAPNLSVANV
jgi:hypothetical protein